MLDHVTITEYKLKLPTYPEPEPESLPMFAKNRIHQRSSGNPYPNRVVLSVVRDRCEEREYDCIRMENAFLRLEILPQLGGRIYSARDMTTGYDFFYKQHVIKPALIGLLGSWISGGCEFNWPCHHRPSTFMPVDVHIEREADGAVTVWLNEHDPLHRMKGMVGIRLAPGEAIFTTRMHVYNRTPLRHSFLWWENAAVPVNETYRLFFPPDVHYVQFHYRKNVTSYPVAHGVYNGIRLGEGTDISQHKNTRSPTSYFCSETNYDYFGGYDEGKRCGVVHVADRHTSIGKKMFTWAYGQLGSSWERALTDSDGAYAELMAGSYSNNQPDFTWLEPYEAKEFSQSWYPIGAIGVPLCASDCAALSIDGDTLHIQATRHMEDAALLVDGDVTVLSLHPAAPREVALHGTPCEIVLLDAQGNRRLVYRKEPMDVVHNMPEPLADNPSLESLKTAHDCYVAGVHVDQYRDPAILPDAYYREALCRDPEHAPSLVAMARFELERGRPNSAQAYGMRGWQALTWRNSHPESGECAYLLGLICETLDRPKDAADWYHRAAYQQDARGRAMTRLSMLAGREGDHPAMLRYAEQALVSHALNSMAQVLSATALLRLRRIEEAGAQLDALLTRIPLCYPALLLRFGPDAFLAALGTDPAQSALDAADDMVQMGEYSLASALLGRIEAPTAMIAYLRGALGDACAFSQARSLPIGIAFPVRPLEAIALSRALQCDPKDAMANNLLGCLHYAWGNDERAVAYWQAAVEVEPANTMALRNLAIARYNGEQDGAGALALLEEACQRKPGDAQLVVESAYVMGRTHAEPAEVIAFLESEGIAREDVLIEHARQLNLAGRYADTLNLMMEHRFTPCEGGEHAVAEQYMLAHHALGRQLLAHGNASEALAHFRAAQVLPDSLGAGLWHEVLLVPHQYHEALCQRALGDEVGAQALLTRILDLEVNSFSDMHLPELPCWQAMALLLRKTPAPAQSLIADHVRRYTQMRSLRDAGFFRTTPFFISYMEPAKKLRAAHCDWQLAMAYRAAGERDKARVLAAQAAQNEPFHMYAQLYVREERNELL